jgi:NhaA family Na+:H+ antiporter
MKATKIFTDFFNSEKAGGLVLIACTILSLTLANSNFGTSYHDFFQTQFAGHSFEYWRKSRMTQKRAIKNKSHLQGKR